MLCNIAAKATGSDNSNKIEVLCRKSFPSKSNALFVDVSLFFGVKNLLWLYATSLSLHDACSKAGWCAIFHSLWYTHTFRGTKFSVWVVFPKDFKVCVLLEDNPFLCDCTNIDVVQFTTKTTNKSELLSRYLDFVPLSICISLPRFWWQHAISHLLFGSLSLSHFFFLSVSHCLLLCVWYNVASTFNTCWTIIRKHSLFHLKVFHFCNDFSHHCNRLGALMKFHFQKLWNGLKHTQKP